MPSYNIQDGNEGFKRFKTVGEGTHENPYVPVVGINVVPDVDSTTGWSNPLSDTNVVSEKLIKETIDGQEITGASYDSNTGDLTLTKTDGNIIVNIPLSSSNTYVTSASFNTSDGVLTLTLSDSSTVTVDLDGRYLENIIEDITPQLGGNLDLNSNDITGTGNISITGEVEATTLIGNMRGATIFKAKAGEALSKGDPVYISGDDLTGNQPVVSIADSDDVNKMPCFGLAAETVSINGSVSVVTFGTLNGLDTSGFSQGDILYISTTGTLTATKPTGESSLIQNIGKVMRSHASAGSIKVGGAGRTNDVPNLNDGNVFIGNASNQVETRGLTLDDIAETATNKHFTASDETKLDGIETGADVTDATNVDAAGAVMNSDTSTASMGFVIDEDTMVSDSPTKVPTQQSVKAYVDANAGGIDPRNSFTQNSGQYIATEGIRARDIGGIAMMNDDGTAGVTVADNGDVDITTKMTASEIKARNVNGLKLHDDGGNGIFVEDGGNVGIGNSTPSEKLDVTGNTTISGKLGIGKVATDTAILDMERSETGGGGLSIRLNNSNTSTGSSHAALVLLGNNGAVQAQYYADGFGGTAYLRTYTNHPISIGTNALERMRIEAGGNVKIINQLGIGKDPSQYAVLDMEMAVTSGAGAGINLKNTASGTSYAVLNLHGNNGGVSAQYYAGGGTAVLRTYTNHGLVFGTNGTERMRITNSGNICIGTTTPNSTFHLKGGTSTQGTAWISSSKSGFTENSHIHYGANMDWYIRSGSTNGKVIIQDGGGNCGIGTGSPSQKLHVVGNAIVSGSLSKGSGSFDIAHPDPKKKDTHRLRHYFVETPSAGGNIYKYQLECNEGDNYIDLPDYFEHLNENSLVWANPFKHFGRAWGEVIEGGKRAKIVVERSGIYNILIFGDRKDAIAMQEFEKYGVEYEIKEK